MSVKEMYMGREMTGTTTLAESVYEEMGGTTPLITESQTVKGAVNELKTIEGTEAYDNTATYAVGDYCIYNSTRYKCITAVTTAEDFDSTKWSATTTNNDISELNSSLTNYTTYVFDPVLIGYRQGYPLYRVRVDIDNFQCNVSTEVTLKADALPSGALNPTISDKSFIIMMSSGTVFSPNCMHFMTYVNGRNIMFRQSFSSSQKWSFRLFFEYGLQN